jgi:hypothetical protein
MKVTVCILLWLIVIAAMICPTPSAKSGEIILPEIPVVHCLTWKEHQEKYPGIKNEDLVSAMLSECAR